MMSSRRLAEKWKWLGLQLVLSLLLLVPVWSVQHPPLQDYPNHLARAYIAVHLTEPSHVFERYYAFVWRAVPNSLSDLLLMTLGIFFPMEIAGKIVLSLILLGLPVGVSVFLQSANPDEGRLYSLLGWVFAYNHFLHRGYLNYTLGLVLLFITLGCYVQWVKSSNKIYFVTAMLLSILTYFAHILPFVILVLSVGTMVAFAREKRRQVMNALLLFLPGFFLLLSFYLSGKGHLYQITWYPKLQDRVTALAQAFVAYTPKNDLLFLLPVFALWALGFVRGFITRRKYRTEWGSIVVSLILIAWMMPRSVSILVRPGQRFLFPAFLIAAVMFPSPPVRWRRPIMAVLIAVAMIIAIRTEIAYLAFRQQFAQMASCVNALEPGSAVGHVTTLPYTGSISPYLHFAEYAAIWKQAPVSNLFTQYSLLRLRSPLPKTVNVQDLKPRLYPQVVVFGSSEPLAGYTLVMQTAICSVWRAH